MLGWAQTCNKTSWFQLVCVLFIIIIVVPSFDYYVSSIPSSYSNCLHWWSMHGPSSRLDRSQDPYEATGLLDQAGTGGFPDISCKEAVNKDGETPPIKYEDLVSHRSQWPQKPTFMLHPLSFYSLILVPSFAYYISSIPLNHIILLQLLSCVSWVVAENVG